MTDRRSADYGYGEPLRYIRRSSVYSSRPKYAEGQLIDSVQKAAAPAVQPIMGSTTVPMRQQVPRRPITSGVMQDITPVAKKSSAPQPQLAVLPEQQETLIVSVVTLSLMQRLFTKGNALVGMAAFIFLFGVGVSLHSLLTNKHVTEQVQALSSESSQNQSEGTSGDQKPDEAHVDATAVAGYRVAPDLPRKITIPKLNVSARVKPLGVNKANQLLAPANIYDAGWYNASAKPGVDAGAVLIDGHVHGPTKPGVFYSLKKLVSGDIIEVERGDGRVVKYRVEKTQKVAAGDVNMGALMTSVRPGVQGLNLITCGGKVDTRTGHYEDRDMVFAVQVE